VKILSIHERRLNASPERAGDVINTLSTREDRLWPHEKWPPMKFDSDLRVGASGGHGPVRYHVSEYVPGRRIEFQFDRRGLAGGLNGRHYFEVVSRSDHVQLRHVVDAECDVKSWLNWHLVIGPMHDALLEDALDRAQTFLNQPPECPACWSRSVRLLRWLVQRFH
jgi:hypothetical protein